MMAVRFSLVVETILKKIYEVIVKEDRSFHSGLFYHLDEFELF
jgi:hypothetical protein